MKPRTTSPRTVIMPDPDLQATTAPEIEGEGGPQQEDASTPVREQLRAAAEGTLDTVPMVPGLDADEILWEEEDGASQPVAIDDDDYDDDFDDDLDDDLDDDDLDDDEDEDDDFDDEDELDDDEEDDDDLDDWDDDDDDDWD